MPAKIYLTKELLLRNVTTDKSGCWVWQRRRDGCGYGVFTSCGREYRAHRVAMHLWHDFDLQSKLYVCHHCDNPPCCNPAHLFVGTQKDNMQDSLRKGRHVDNKGSRHGKARVDEDDVLLIKALGEAGWAYQHISAIFGTNRGHARDIIKRRIWRHI